jgi:broad specificity phosphatase PhoE
VTKMDILLVRHGEAAAAWGEHADPGLSPLGRQQAQQARDELQVFGRLHLISSPLLRAQETALPLANIQRISVEIDERFREIPSPAGIEDRRGWLSEFMRQDWLEQGPEIQQWREASWDALFEYDKPVAIFSHFMVINSVVARLTGAVQTVCCVPDNASITHLKLEGGALNLVEVGRQQKTNVN